MTIELLTGPLAVSDSPGLSTIDPRFGDIVSLVQDARYEEAAGQSRLILEGKIYDIRVIGYYLYGVFLTRGVGGLADIYQCLTVLLRDDLDALGPAKKRKNTFSPF